MKIYANNDVGWLFYEVEVCVWFDVLMLDNVFSQVVGVRPGAYQLQISLGFWGKSRLQHQPAASTRLAQV